MKRESKEKGPCLTNTAFLDLDEEEVFQSTESPFEIKYGKLFKTFRRTQLITHHMEK